jgi:hypothetical protein
MRKSVEYLPTLPATLGKTVKLFGVKQYAGTAIAGCLNFGVSVFIKKMGPITEITTRPNRLINLKGPNAQPRFSLFKECISTWKVLAKLAQAQENIRASSLLSILI